MGSWVRDRVAATLTGGPEAVADGPVVAGDVAHARVSAGEWAGLRAELGRVGNNLNQAVRLANASGVNPARVVEMADAAQGTRFAVAGLLAAVRVVTGAGPVHPPVVGSRSVAEQLADADAERVFAERVRVAAELLYSARVARGRAALAERVAARRAPEAAPSPSVLPVGESPGGSGR